MQNVKDSGCSASGILNSLFNAYSAVFIDRNGHVVLHIFQKLLLNHIGSRAAVPAQFCAGPSRSDGKSKRTNAQSFVAFLRGRSVSVLQLPAYFPAAYAPAVHGRASAESSITEPLAPFAPFSSSSRFPTGTGASDGRIPVILLSFCETGVFAPYVNSLPGYANG